MISDAKHLGVRKIRSCNPRMVIPPEAPAGCSKRSGFTLPHALSLPRQPLRPGTRLVPRLGAAPELTLISRFTPYASRFLGAMRKRRMGEARLGTAGPSG
jgi:hypothetical protein